MATCDSLVSRPPLTLLPLSSQCGWDRDQEIGKITTFSFFKPKVPVHLKFDRLILESSVLMYHDPAPKP